MAGELPFLEVDGAELANAARTFEYLERGLQPQIQLGRTGYCATLATELGAGGVAPWLDPAPWYDAAAPHSADFLGIVLLDLAVDVQATRPAVQRTGGRGGTAIGTEAVAGATMTIRAWLVARTAQGLAYGRQWLRARLGQDPCNTCALNRLRYHEFCANGVPVGLGEWLLYDVGVTGDGIRRVDGDPDGAWEEIELTLTSAHAARFKAATVSLAPAPLAIFGNDDDVVAFATDPFAGGLLSYLPAPSAAGMSVSSGRLQIASGVFGHAYRVGFSQRDFVVTCKYHTPGVLSSFDQIGLAARWTNPAHAHAATSPTADPDLGDSFVAGELFSPSAGVWQLRVSERYSSDTPSTEPAYTWPASTLNSASPTFAITANTDYWLRFAVQGDVVTLAIYTTDPYDAAGTLIPGVAPLAATVWPAATHALSAHGVAAFGTFGIARWWWNGSGSAPYVDDLRLRPECMDFVRWLCEAPPAAATAVELAPATPGGTVAAIVTLDATNGQIANAYVEARHGGCDEDGDVFARIDVPLITAGAKLVVDSSRGRVELVDAAGNVFDGSALIALDEGRAIQWIEAPRCDSPICVTAGVGSWCGTHEDATIKIEAQERSR
jgi:hypothetical protein